MFSAISFNREHNKRCICFSAYSSNTALSSRLEEHSDHHDRKMGSHSRLLNDLSETHDDTANRVENVAGQVGRLESDINKMEGEPKANNNDKHNKIIQRPNASY